MTTIKQTSPNRIIAAPVGPREVNQTRRPIVLMDGGPTRAWLVLSMSTTRR